MVLQPPAPQRTPLVDERERAMLRAALRGIVLGMLSFGLISAGIARLGWPQENWGFVLGVAAFAGFWAGLFFGSAGGIALYQLRHGHVEDADEVQVPTVAADLPPVRVAGQVIDSSMPPLAPDGTEPPATAPDVPLGTSG